MLKTMHHITYDIFKKENISEYVLKKYALKNYTRDPYNIHLQNNNKNMNNNRPLMRI